MRLYLKTNKHIKNNKIQIKTLETLKTELKGKCNSTAVMTKERHGISNQQSLINIEKIKQSKSPITQYLLFILVKFLEKNRTNGDEKITLNLPSLAKSISLQKERNLNINQDKLSQLESHYSGHRDKRAALSSKLQRTLSKHKEKETKKFLYPAHHKLEHYRENILNIPQLKGQTKNSSVGSRFLIRYHSGEKKWKGWNNTEKSCPPEILYAINITSKKRRECEHILRWKKMRMSPAQHR